MSPSLWFSISLSILLVVLGNYSRPAYAEDAGRQLVAYSFEDSLYALSDEQLYFFNNARGHVGLSEAMALSGYHSIELREARFDQEFTELQGRFATLTNGTVRFHFALLVENPEEELNIAIAGPEHFRVKKDGIAMWLHTEKGVLIHESDGIPRKLFSLVPFQWYVFDLVYDIGRGRYDLFVRREGQQSAELLLKSVPNASNNPASSIDRFSFIGDLGDRSQVHYFIDDIVLSAYPSPEAARAQVLQTNALSSVVGHTNSQGAASSGSPALSTSSRHSPPLRRGFFDGYLELQMLLRQQLRCLPAVSPEDLALTALEMQSVLDGTTGASLDLRLQGALKSQKGSELPAPPWALWIQGCVLLSEGRSREAEEFFSQSLATSHASALFLSSKILALVSKGDSESARILVPALEREWGDDPRLPVVKSFLESAQGRFSTARAVLEKLANQFKGDPDAHLIAAYLAGGAPEPLIEALKRDHPQDWRTRLDDVYIAQSYYFHLLWDSKFAEARRYALDVVEALEQRKIPASSWKEREADAAFLDGELRAAVRLYEEILRVEPGRLRIWRKLLDVATKISRPSELQRYRQRYATARQHSPQTER